MGKGGADAVDDEERGDAVQQRRVVPPVEELVHAAEANEEGAGDRAILEEGRLRVLAPMVRVERGNATSKDRAVARLAVLVLARTAVEVGERLAVEAEQRCVGRVDDRKGAVAAGECEGEGTRLGVQIPHLGERAAHDCSRARRNVQINVK